MSKCHKALNATVAVLLVSVGSIVLATCRRPSLAAIEMARVKELLATQGKLEWFSSSARAAISSKNEQDKIIREIENQMPALTGHAAFSCWVDKDDSTGDGILYGTWRTGLSSTGLLVGSTNFVPSTNAWPRYRFERLTNGVYVFYTFI